MGKVIPHTIVQSIMGGRGFMPEINATVTGMLVAACFVLIIGSLAKIFLEVDRFSPGAPAEERGRILFRQLYLALDFVLLALGLLFSARAFVLGVGKTFTPFFGHLVLGNVAALFICILLWHASGKTKCFPIEKVKNTSPDGEGVDEEERVMLLKGLRSRVGFTTLIAGNLLGLICLLGTFLCVIEVF
jgi:hypothetical protein